MAAADVPPGVAWSSLSTSQQSLLEDFSTRWDTLPPARQHALARGSERWLAMTPEQVIDAVKAAKIEKVGFETKLQEP